MCARFNIILGNYPRLLSICLLSSTSLLAQKDRVADIDNRVVAELRGVVNPMAQPSNDLGPVEPSFPIRFMQIMLPPSADQAAALDRLLSAQRDPTSASYHQWLSPEEYADRFGMSRSDIAKISAWLKSVGFTIDYTARGRDFIGFSGTAAQVQAAFHAPVHRYLANGETHFAIAGEPSLPKAIRSLAGSILGLDDFIPKPMNQPENTGSTGAHYLAPGDLAAIYDLNRLYQQGIDGTGQSIVIVGQTNIDPTDIATFRSTFGLNPTTIKFVPVPGTSTTVGTDLTEADLDLEWAGAIARNATLIYVYASNADTAVLYAIDQNLAPVLNESYGSCIATASASSPATYQTAARKGNSEGITWVNSSGDAGASSAACEGKNMPFASHGQVVSLISSIPEVTAVGGTELNEQGGNYWNVSNGAFGGSALGYIPEMVWNDTTYGTGQSNYLSSGGGGVSALFAKPTWQAGPGVPADGQRDVPDISFLAAVYHDAYIVFSSGQTVHEGGTSVSSPVFAGIVALLNQASKTPAGNVNPLLYSLAVSAPEAFHDVTVGSNIVPCEMGSPNCATGSFGFSAAKGYDLASGLGSLDVYNFVSAVTGAFSNVPAPLTLSPSSTTAGAAVFTLQVTGSGFTSASIVQWNGSSIPTTFVSATQLTATVAANLVASAATDTVAVVSGSSTSATLYFTVNRAPLVFSNQRVSAQAPAASGCSVPAGSSYFSPNGPAVQLFFSVTLTAADSLTYVWLAPDGSVTRGTWNNNTSLSCLNTSLTLTNVTASQYGSWSVHVYDNGDPVFSLPFTVNCTLTSAPAVTSVNSASSYGGYAYFTSGSWLEVKGTNLADPADPRLTLSVNPGQWNSADFLGANAPTSLDGVSVAIDGIPAYVWYLSPGQLNVQAPQDSAAGSVAITVTTCKATSRPFNLTRQALAPGLLAPSNYAANGTQYLVATFASDGAYVLNTLTGASFGLNSRPAKPGDLVILYGIGFGPVTPNIGPGVVVGQSNALINPVAVFFGTTPATLSYAGLAGGFVGLDEIYVTVPNVADGDYLVNVTQNGNKLQQTASLTVHN